MCLERDLKHRGEMNCKGGMNGSQTKAVHRDSSTGTAHRDSGTSPLPGADVAFNPALCLMSC